MEHRIQTKIIALTVIVLLITSLLSCKKENMGDCVKSKGAVVSEIRKIETVDSLFLGNRINFTIIHDTINFIEITAGENLLSLIEVKQSGTTLSIIDKNKCNWVRDLSVWPEVKLHLNSLKILATQGTNNVRSESSFLSFPNLVLDIWENNGTFNLFVENDELYVRQHTGSSDINVKGRTNRLLIYMAGISKGDYSELTTLYATIDQRSSAKVEAKVLEDLYVSIFNDGDVIIKGNPELKKLDQQGNGALIFK